MTGGEREGKKRMGDRNQGPEVRLVADPVEQTVIWCFHFLLIVAGVSKL